MKINQPNHNQTTKNHQFYTLGSELQQVNLRIRCKSNLVRNLKMLSTTHLKSISTPIYSKNHQKHPKTPIFRQYKPLITLLQQSDHYIINTWHSTKQFAN